MNACTLQTRIRFRLTSILPFFLVRIMVHMVSSTKKGWKGHLVKGVQSLNKFVNCEWPGLVVELKKGPTELFRVIYLIWTSNVTESIICVYMRLVCVFCMFWTKWNFFFWGTPFFCNEEKLLATNTALPSHVATSHRRNFPSLAHILRRKWKSLVVTGSTKVLGREEG